MEKNKILFTALTKEELSTLMESSVRKAIDGSPQQTENGVLLTTRQAAALIHYRPSSLYELVRKGKIPYLKVRGKLLFQRAQLLGWVQGNTPDIGEAVHGIVTKPPPKRQALQTDGDTDKQLSLYPDIPDGGHTPIQKKRTRQARGITNKKKGTDK